jgi:hypothetical protein
VNRAYSGRSGVQYRPENYATFTAQSLVAVPVTPAEYAEFRRLMSVIEGCPYSRHGIEGFVEGMNRPEKPGTIAFICSSMCAWLCYHAGPNMLPAELRGELREISPNGWYYIARMMAFSRRGMEMA